MRQEKVFNILNSKTIVILLSIIFVTISFFPSSSMAIDNEDKLVIATFQSPFPPMVWYEKKNGRIESLGAEPDILRELAKRAGIQYELVIMPFSRIKANLNEGKIDASLGGWKLPEREKYGIYMDRPMIYDFFEVYVVKGKEFEFEKVEDLFDKRIGKIRGVNVYLEMDQAIKDSKMKAIEADNRTSLIKMLRLGRLDAMLSSTVVTGFDLQTLGATDVVALPKRLTKPQGTYIWFSKKANIDPMVIERLNHAMESMYKDATIKNILLKYGIRQDF